MSLKDLLADLQKSYLASFPEKVANLEALWKSGQLEELESEYHKLKGTGRTYGLPEVTQLGEAMESLCSRRKSETLALAVPLSIQVLRHIQDARLRGEAFKADEDRDFRVIVDLVVNAAS